ARGAAAALLLLVLSYPGSSYADTRSLDRIVARMDDNDFTEYVTDSERYRLSLDVGDLDSGRQVYDFYVRLEESASNSGCALVRIQIDTRTLYFDDDCDAIPERMEVDSQGGTSYG